MSEMQMTHFLRTWDLRVCCSSLWSAEKGSQDRAVWGRKCFLSNLPNTRSTPMIISLFPFPIWGEWMVLLCTEGKISFLVSISSSASSYLFDLQTRYLCWSTALHFISLQNRSKKGLPCRGTVNIPFTAFKANFYITLKQLYIYIWK